MIPTSASSPDNSEILEGLGGAVCGKSVVSLRRRPYRYTTSFPLDEVELLLADGRSVSLILKDLTWERLPEDARLGKPAFLYEPRREIETYLRILGPSGLGPHCFAASYPRSGSGSWLVLEKVHGVELWQVGDAAVWDAAARWAARLHARFVGADVVSLNPYLLRCDAAWFRTWAARARDGLAGSADHRSRDLIEVIDRYAPVADRLAALPTSFVHGEYFPSNILVDPETYPPRVWPVDWEMAAVGPCLFDVATLVSGWEHAERQRLVAAYRDEILKLGVAIGTMDEVLEAVHICQLHFALQWLGWSRNWTPPPEHARDWIGQALESARELSL